MPSAIAGTRRVEAIRLQGLLAIIDSTYMSRVISFAGVYNAYFASLGIERNVYAYKADCAA